MTEDKIKDILIKNKTEFYSCSEKTFHTEGNTFRIRDINDSPDTFYITKIYDHNFITCGSTLSQRLKKTDQIITLELLRDHSADYKIEDYYPQYIYKKDQIESRPLPAGYKICSMDPSNHPPLQNFLDSCTAEDIDEALIDLDDPDDEIRMVFYGDVPVAYAGYRLIGNGLGDVGILTLPEHRQKGLGTAAVAEATRACIENGFLPYYRTSRDNKGSQAIAEGLGYDFIWSTYKCSCT